MIRPQVMTQSWKGVLGEGRATATVMRTFTVAPQSEEARASPVFLILPPNPPFAVLS